MSSWVLCFISAGCSTGNYSFMLPRTSSCMQKLMEGWGGKSRQFMDKIEEWQLGIHRQRAGKGEIKAEWKENRVSLHFLSTFHHLSTVCPDAEWFIMWNPRVSAECG